MTEPARLINDLSARYLVDVEYESPSVVMMLVGTRSQIWFEDIQDDSCNSDTGHMLPTKAEPPTHSSSSNVDMEANNAALISLDRSVESN